MVQQHKRARARRSRDEMVQALARHTRLLRAYAELALSNEDYLGEIAGKLRLLIVETKQNTPLLLAVANEFAIDLKPSASTALTYSEFLDSMAFAYNLDSPDFVTVSYRDLIRSWAEQQGAPHEDWDVDEPLAALFSMKGKIDGRSPFANNLIFLARMVVKDAEATLGVLLKPNTAGAKV